LSFLEGKPCPPVGSGGVDVGVGPVAAGETPEFRQLAYKTGWYGSRLVRLVIAARWYPSSMTCHACGNVQHIGWYEHWTCTRCGTSHHRDDNAAVNFTRYEPPATGDSALGLVKTTVKRGPTARPGLTGQVAMERGRNPANRQGTTPRRGASE
jgi:putative transposase